MRRILACLPLMLLLGCGGGLNDERTVELVPFSATDLGVEPAKSQKTMKVTFTSPGVPVSVFVFLKEDQAAVDRTIPLQAGSHKVIAGKDKAESGTVEAIIPANKEAVVRVAADKGKASVKVKMTN